MNLLRLDRDVMTENATIGHLYGPDGFKMCDTLEDAVRKVKIPGKTAIPIGRYELVVTFSSRFQRLMPLLLNVPFFSGIRIHWGNTGVDTSGCILVSVYDKNIIDFVGQSRDTYDRIFPIIKKLTEKDKTFIDINGGFRAEDWIREVKGAV